MKRELSRLVWTTLAALAVMVGMTVSPADDPPDPLPPGYATQGLSDPPDPIGKVKTCSGNSSDLHGLNQECVKYELGADSVDYRIAFPEVAKALAAMGVDRFVVWANDDGTTGAYTEQLTEPQPRGGRNPRLDPRKDLITARGTFHQPLSICDDDLVDCKKYGDDACKRAGKGPMIENQVRVEVQPNGVKWCIVPCRDGGQAMGFCSDKDDQ